MGITFKDIEILQSSNVRMKDPHLVLNKINRIVKDGKNLLQIITDYDLTLTKQHVNGDKTLSSFCLLSNWEQLPPGFMERDSALKEQYYPIETDLKMTPEEKTPHMIEWYHKSEELWKGVKINLEGLRKLIAEKGPELRDGTIELFKRLEKNEIPILVLSAGLGDVLVEVLRHNNLIQNDYFHIISNFFRLENDLVQGFGCLESGNFLHPFNKNGFGCSHYFSTRTPGRHNVILMGDSLGDSGMAEGIKKIKTVLKIGFLYGTPSVINDSIPSFMENFDIVLVDDQTMNVLSAIIDLVLHPKHT